MPLAYRIDPDAGIVTITGDYAEPSEWKVLLGTIVRDPGYRPGFSFIRDLRKAAHPVSAEAVRSIIALVREYWPVLGAWRAAVVTGRRAEDLAFIAHALAEDQGLPLRAFTTYEEAVAWVRRPAGAASPPSP